MSDEPDWKACANAAPMAVAPIDAARMAGIGRTKLYQALRSGSLRSFKIGSRRLIRVSTLDAWLAQHEECAQEADDA